MAIRYTQDQKDKVVAFVIKHNEANGRGGQSAAVAKFKINPITVASWLKSAGVKTPGKKRGAKGGKKAVAPKQKSVKKSVKKSKKVGGSVGAVLNRLQAIQVEIDSLQAEFNELKLKI